MEKEKRIRCWRCEGTCQVFGYAVPGDLKETWHACRTCQGKGWYIPVDPIQAALWQKTLDFFRDLQSPIVDVTNQIDPESKPT
jgi:hypothetical protein